MDAFAPPRELPTRHHARAGDPGRVAAIAVSIGIAQADTLGEVMASHTWRLALFGLVFVIVATGGVIATVMWLTAPTLAAAPSPAPDLMAVRSGSRW